MKIAVARMCRWVVALAIAAGSTSRSLAQQTGPIEIPDAWFEPLGWKDLDGWASDDHAAAFATFVASCGPILHDSHLATDPRPMAAALKSICRRAQAARSFDAARAAAFFEDNFRPVRIARLGDPTGFLTGYYEPIVDGSRFPTPEFHAPLYRPPDDLVVLGGQAADGDAFPNRAQVGRRVDDHVVVPYFDRGEIEEGALDGRHLEICWIRDPIEAMIIQIQGSARIRLEDGLMLRVNYAAHNGLPFTPVGRVLIERNLVPKEEMSLDRIRKWMRANPDQASEVRRTNRSFVFFRISGLGNDDEPKGGEGVRLTPGRSIAVDRALHVYGTPFFIAADLPTAGNGSTAPFRRLMIAQDTGSAIVGPARADLYFGAGDDAGHVAGRIRSPGRLTMLIPREIDPVRAGLRMPLPRSRPVFEAKAKPKPTNGERTAIRARRGGRERPVMGVRPRPEQRIFRHHHHGRRS